MKIILFGSTGQVGKAIKKRFSNIFDLIIPSRLECDFLQPKTISNFLELTKPDIIINAAAYTNVDKAEDPNEYESVFLVNSHAPRAISQTAKKLGSMLIHFSSDYVFNGKTINKYTEQDIATPLNIYGNSKLNGDFFISQNLSKFLILRTSWVFSEDKNNFISKVLQLCLEKESFEVISDQVGTPTSANYLAIITKKLVEYYIKDKKNFNFGLYNVAGSNEISWFEFANLVIDKAYGHGLISNQNFIGIKPTLTKNYTQAAVRPKYSSLNVKKFFKTFGIEACDWKVDVCKILKEKINEFK